MEQVMYASILSSIVLVLVGLIKLPLVRFKGKKFYKAGLTLLTIILVIGACIICQLFIREQVLLSWGSLSLLLITFGETMLSYNGIYEGLGLKGLMKKLEEKVKELIAKNPQNKLTKYAEKVGLDNAIKLIANYVEEKHAEVEAVKTENKGEVQVAKEV